VCLVECRSSIADRHNCMASSKGPSVAIIVVAVVMATTMYHLYFAGVQEPKTPRCGMHPPADGTGLSGLLLSPVEMRQLLYAEGTAMNVSDWRYTNMIRSRMTRPDPSKPIRLNTNYMKEQHFSDVRNSSVLLQVIGFLTL